MRDVSHKEHDDSLLQGWVVETGTAPRRVTRSTLPDVASEWADSTSPMSKNHYHLSDHPALLSTHPPDETGGSSLVI